jgi:opacity protein-like surface antigen
METVMRNRILSAVLLAATFLALVSTPALAQQSISLNLGAFIPKGEDSRVNNDVLLQDRQYLLFRFKDFNGATVGADYLVGLGGFLEASVGASYYSRTAHSVYDQWVNADGSEVAQDLKLQIVPLTATLRILPFGRRGGFEPYVGGGVGVFLWRYSETGEFVDFADESIFRARYIGTGTAVGPVAVFGARFSPARRVGAGMEFRYQKAEGKLDGNQFYGDRIDLGGWSALLTLRIGF